MTPELFCFLTSALCTLFIVGIECYHILNTKQCGTVVPLIEYAVKAIDEKLKDDMYGDEMV